MSSDYAQQAKSLSINIQQHKYGLEDSNPVDIESPGILKNGPSAEIQKRMKIEEGEISSENQDSEYLKEKERQEQTRQMIEQAKKKRQKCIDDSSSSEDSVKSMSYTQNIEIEEGDDEYLDFKVENEENGNTESAQKE